MKPQADAVRALAALPSLGRTSAEMLIEAGVESPEALRAMGAVEAFARLRFAHGRRVTTNFLYALDIAIRGVHWRDLSDARMAELRAAAEDVKARQIAMAQTSTTNVLRLKAKR